MLKIGEFARIAKVSIHLLRYYDKIDLLKPSQTDTQSGYRYYHANQLPRLNRIMALKELGFSLDQVSLMLDDPISPDEIRGMLRLKRAQVEEVLLEEQARLARIELRLRQIDEEGLFPDYNIEVKQVSPQSILTIRDIPNQDPFVKGIFEEFYTQLTPIIDKVGYGIVLFDKWDAEAVHLGFLVNAPPANLAMQVGGHAVDVQILPSISMMATLLFSGARTDLHIAYGQMVTWFEAHNYQYAFPARQLYIQPGQDAHDAANIVELQMPLLMGPRNNI